MEHKEYLGKMRWLIEALGKGAITRTQYTTTAKKLNSIFKNKELTIEEVEKVFPTSDKA